MRKTKAFFLSLALSLFALESQALQIPSGGLRVEVSPNPAIVESGGSLQIGLRVLDLSGSPLDVRVKWMVIPRSLGSITEEGLFQAGPSTGKGIIRAAVEWGKNHGVGHTLLRVESAGKGRKITVGVSPDGISLSPAGSQKFDVRVSTLEGRPLEGEVTWRVLPQSLGRITSDGNFFAEEEGEGKIIARVRTGEGEGVGYARIRISSGEGIALNPSFLLMKPGETQKFKVEVLKGSLSLKPPEITWKVDPPDFGTVDADGIFHAGEKEGKGKVIAEIEEGKFTAMAVITISEGGEKLIVKILPKEIFLSPGEMRQLEATITKPDGTPVDADLAWQVIPERLGILTQEGSFTAGFEVLTGQVGVFAKSDLGEGFDIVPIRIRPRSFQLKITPSSITLLPNQSKALEVEVRDEGDEVVNPPLLLWTLEPPELGRVEEGIFYAGPKPMEGRIWVRLPPEMGVGECYAQVSITTIIRRRERFTVTVEPPSVKLHPNNEVDFDATIVDSRGNSFVDSLVEWTVEPVELGEIYQNGLFRAGTPPYQVINGKVIARINPKFGVGEGYANITITNLDIRRRARFDVQISEERLTLRPGQSHLFRVQVMDSSGNIIPIPETEFLWSVKPPDLGQITQDGRFTAGMPPAGQDMEGSVIARINPKLGVGEDHCNIFILPIVRHKEVYTLIFQPQNPTVHVNTTTQFTAFVTDREGKDVDAVFEWGVEGDIGTLFISPDDETVQFLAGQSPGVGSIYVIAHPSPHPEITLRASTRIIVVEE